MKLTHLLIAATLTLSGASAGVAQDNAMDSAAMMTSNHSGDFTKKRYTINGDWVVSKQDGQTMITFKDNFKTKGGPDLKVFLSPKSVDELNGKTALDGAQYVSVLQSNSGEQSYVLPSDISLDDFKSVIIQCEAFSVLWGGFDIPTPAS